MTHNSAEAERSDLPSASIGLSDPGRGRRRLTVALGLVTVVLSLCSGLATYLILARLTPIVPTPTVRNPSHTIAALAERIAAHVT